MGRTGLNQTHRPHAGASACADDDVVVDIDLHVASGFDFSAIESLARDGAQKTGTRLPDIPMPETPQANVKLVTPHVGKLKEWLPMAILGL